MKQFVRIFTSLMFILMLSSGLLANGLSLNSIGTRALGMGGAFVGLANDATAIYWNPAGIANVPGGFAGLYVTDIIPMSTYKMDMAGVDAKANTNHYVAPNFFGTYQLNDLTLGLGVYVPAGLGVEWEGSELKNLTAGGTYEWMSKIGVVNISPAIAYRLSEQFSLGLALNIYYAMFDLKRPAEVAANIFSQYTEESTGTGFGVTVGGQYKFSEMFTAGATFRMKTTVKMSGTAKNPAFAALQLPAESEFDREVAWPMWLAGGIAVKPSENLTITFDAQYSQWAKSSTEFVTEYANAGWKQATEASGANKFVLKWKDATQIRLGLEYHASDALDLRAGYYYDPAPAPDETLNILFPSSTNHVATAGVGYQTGSLALEFSLEYLFGAERDIPLSPENDMPGIHQMDIFAFSLGLGYSF